jgi:DNA-binding GntR family transcriptional regulator
MNTSDVQYTQISKYLIGEIVSKRLAENQIIQMRDISRITGISLFKVNEVLCSLSKNEILKFIPNTGYFLRPLNLKTIQDTFKTLILLETKLLESIDFDDFDFETNFFFLNKLKNEDHIRQYLDLNLNFHRSLRMKSSNSTIEHLLEQLYTKVFFIDSLTHTDLNELKSLLERKFELLESLRNSKKHMALYQLKLVWEDHLQITTEAQKKLVNTRV